MSKPTLSPEMSLRFMQGFICPMTTIDHRSTAGYSFLFQYGRPAGAQWKCTECGETRQYGFNRAEKQRVVLLCPQCKCPTWFVFDHLS